MRSDITSIYVGLMVLFTASFAFIGCHAPEHSETKNTLSARDSLNTTQSIESEQVVIQREQGLKSPELSQTEMRMMAAGLVDVRLLDTSIRVDLRYAGNNNFLHTNLYGNIKKAYLTDDCAKKLALAQTLLHQQSPELHLLVWDAARPLSVQQRMWDTLELPFEERTKYVSNPANHSLHNYGCAVDLTIQENQGNNLDMGTDFDAFDTIAHPEFEWLSIQNKTLTLSQLEHRKLLRNVMHKAGFSMLNSEWWHFNCCSREYAKVNYMLVE